METFGQNAFSCPVIDCSYYTFDWDRFTSNDPYTFDELINHILKDKLNVKYQIKNYGYVVEKSTLEWWGQQSKEAQANIKPLDSDITLEKFFENIMDYARQTKLSAWWSRSNTFDPIILARIANSIGRKLEMDSVLPYWLVRDTRTFIDAKSNFKEGFNSFIPAKDEENLKSKFAAHDSVHDLAVDILRLQVLSRIERDLDLPE